MIQANGENRKWIAMTLGAALLTTAATELVKWGIEEAKKRYGTKGESARAGAEPEVK